MKKNHTTFLLICNVLLLIVIFITFYFPKPSSADVVYVDNIKLFNGFNMSQDLGKINTKKITKQKKKLDSLYTIYSILREQENKEKTQELEVQLRTEDQELKKMNEYLSKDIRQKVWNRLDQYIKEYGIANQCKIILGTQGVGNVMYAQEEINITTKILEYANAKYEGN